MLRLLSKISLLFVLPVIQLYAEERKSLSLIYDEVESEVGAQTVRYLINDRYVRIDDGTSGANFILFNVDNEIIYSVNHADQTILKITQHAWSRPELSFEVKRHFNLAKDAPEIEGRKIYQYQLMAKNNMCTQAFVVKDLYLKEMQVMHQYQQVLSGQQVKSLSNMPVEMQTPCVLLDQIYHEGNYYLKGLPVQITFSRGYTKLIKSYEEISVDEALFVLPAGYKEYLPFGG